MRNLHLHYPWKSRLDLNGPYLSYTEQPVSVTGIGTIAGGTQGPSSSSNGIHYLTISTLGNTQDFGDLTAAATQGSGMSNSTRGVFQLGNAGGSQSNAVDYVTIQTTGNAKDFGDLSPGRVFEAAACSDSHGGIS